MKDTPKRLVDVLRPVRATALDVWFQEIRLQFILGPPLKAQILFDRKHKYHPKLSRPLGYYQFEQAQDLINLAIDVLAGACTLAMQSRIGSSIGSFEIRNTVDSLWNMIREDTCELVDKSLKAIHTQATTLASKQLPTT